jgi:hypothetical protein
MALLNQILEVIGNESAPLSAPFRTLRPAIMPRQPHHSPNYGGKRPGAGRGYAPDKYSKELLRQAHEEGIHPFVFLLNIVRDETKDEKMRVYAASSCLPYCAQKLQQTEIKITNDLDSLSTIEKIALASSLRTQILEQRPDMMLPVIEGEVVNVAD